MAKFEHIMTSEEKAHFERERTTEFDLGNHHHTTITLGYKSGDTSAIGEITQLVIRETRKTEEEHQQLVTFLKRLNLPYDSEDYFGSPDGVCTYTVKSEALKDPQAVARIKEIFHAEGEGFDEYFAGINSRKPESK